MSPLFTRDYAKESNLDCSVVAAQTTGRYTAKSDSHPDQTKFANEAGAARGIPSARNDLR